MTSRLSVAVVTRNRPELLGQCLASLRAQDSVPDEIVVSDDSSTAHAADANRALAGRFGARHVEGPRRGLYANRNHAALQCTGTHILTSDDDHTHPAGYVKCIRELVASDPRRIWSFGERDPADPSGAIHLPGEYGLRGNARLARNPERCAAIADGSTVYPRAVFDSGARYCEAYRFGDLYLLWGRELERRGWHISVSEATHVMHLRNASLERAADAAWLREQIEANHFVRFACALGIFRSRYSACRALALLARDILSPRPMSGYSVRVRLSLAGAVRAVRSGLREAARLRQL
jgi:glycosyltransferase involved in cell wall biosynthesis